MEEKEIKSLIVKMNSGMGIGLILLILSMIFNLWWLWLIFVTNTISDIILYKRLVRRINERKLP